MIIRKSTQTTSGTNGGPIQSFYQNIFYDPKEVVGTPFVFDIPKYTTAGGSQDYYGQNPNAIFTNLVKPFLRFDFSANTDSFGTGTSIIHDIYRVDWETYRIVQGRLNADLDDSIQSEEIITEEIEEIDEITGEIKRRRIVTGKSQIKNEVKASRKPGNVEGSRVNNTVVKPTIADLQDMLDEPLYSLTAKTSGITTNIYDLILDQDIKKSGEFKTELFKDRSQYIVDTRFVFKKERTPGLINYFEYTYDEFNNLLLTGATSGITTGGTTGHLPTGVTSALTYDYCVDQVTNSSALTINKGEFEGINFKGGHYFTYFVIPDKPMFEYPSPEGQLETFTPEIFWTNGESADEYLVQVNYNTGDTAFTGSVTSYIVPKTDEYMEIANSKTKSSDTEFSSDKKIRKYQLSLKSNSCAIYRVGNVKKIENLFGVRQSVVTFSNYKQICTQPEAIITQVFTENDSPHRDEIAGLGSPPSLQAESPLEEYMLSGTVSGSTVVGATMQLVYPNASFVTTVTDSAGTFSFDSLEAGTYTLNTTIAGWAADSRAISITDDTSVNISLRIQWDNTAVTWGDKSNDIIKY